MSGAVLCPVDLSHEASWQIALPEAAREARSRGATLHLLAVVPDVGLSLVSQHLPEGFEKGLVESAAADLARIAAEALPGDLPVECHVRHGHVLEEVLGAADALGAELIVLASHKPDALRTLFVSSVADRVVHHAQQSVLVVRRSA